MVGRSLIIGQGLSMINLKTSEQATTVEAARSSCEEMSQEQAHMSGFWVWVSGTFLQGP